MSEQNSYQPPRVWQWEQPSGGKFANVNRPVSGATHDKQLPVGKHPIQLYSMGTPNGVKITIMLEELLALGITGAEYDAWLVNIHEGDQFGTGFTALNPNSKIPAMVDHSDNETVKVFESGAILLYLAEKFHQFLPSDGPERAVCLSWLFWQIGSAPYLGGGFGHFYAYAPEQLEYPINRFTMEVKRQLDVLDKQLEKSRYITGDNYSIADIAIYPWYGALVDERLALYNAAEFLDVASYTHVQRWSQEMSKRPAVARGRRVNRTGGEDNYYLSERHDAKDFD